MITFAVITCSDTRSEKEDTAGALLRELIADQGWQCAAYDVVKDERPEIAAAIVRAADEEKVDVVLTCGGTGLSLALSSSIFGICRQLNMLRISTSIDSG